MARNTVKMEVTAISSFVRVIVLAVCLGLSAWNGRSTVLVMTDWPTLATSFSVTCFHSLGKF